MTNNKDPAPIPAAHHSSQASSLKNNSPLPSSDFYHQANFVSNGLTHPGCLSRLKFPSNMEDWCRWHYLNDDTINLLKHHGLFTPEAIKSLTRNDIDNLNISMGQKTVLRHLLRSENAQLWMEQVKIPQRDDIDFGWIHYITELFILCDGCGRDPITGTRFVCTQCDNFDYCSTCFHTRNHKDHLFTRIDCPGSKPLYAGRSGSRISEEGGN